MDAIYSMHVHTRIDAYHTCVSPGRLLSQCTDHACWDVIEKMSHVVTLVMIITEVNEGINLTASSK